MEGYGKEMYGAGWSGDYDAIFPEAPTPMIDRLAEFAGGGRALELAIGTGRVAVPLVGRGVDLVGIDTSREMVARLRSKPGAGRSRWFWVILPRFR